ncbi:MAG: terpene cyclase/mutase family protein [Akkermansiaceae bacterium]|nr:terpene cyclase/mutase family protein [Akkermansiaceae bacterium]
MDTESSNHHTILSSQKSKVSWWSKIGGGSLLFAAIFHAILIVIGAVLIFKVYKEPEKKVDFLPAGGGGERGSETTVQQKRQTQVMPVSNGKRVFAEGAKATFSLPDQGDNFGEMSALSPLSSAVSGGLGAGAGGGGGAGFGKGPGLAGGLGGGGTGKLFGLIPETMRKRCSREDRLQRLQENGGTPACEDAVLKSLRWFKANQNPDGSWGTGKQAGMTGLALLAYMGRCETPASEEFGESAMRGIVYLVNLGVQNKAKLSKNLSDISWPYEHAIATYALGEAATFCKEAKIEIPNLMEVTEQAGQFIIDNQHDSGGWAYLYSTEKNAHVDTSVAGWQIQALKACSHTGIKYKGLNSCINKGLDYMNNCQNENGGYGYKVNREPAEELEYFTLTGVGMLCNQMWGKADRSEVSKASSYILEHTKFDYNTEFCDLYGHYYESQAMMQRGGEDWKKYNNLFRDQLVSNQDANGSWKVPGAGAKPRASGALFMSGTKDGEIYRNALCTLMLEVYYRFLNTDSGGKNRRNF